MQYIWIYYYYTILLVFDEYKYTEQETCAVARKTARCEICQFPQSPLLFETAHSCPLIWNGRCHIIVVLVLRTNSQNDIWAQVYIGLTEIFDKNLENPREYPHKPYVARN